jgi:hypothetical protein
MVVRWEPYRFPLVLQLIETVIDAVPFHQLGVGTDLAHFAVVQKARNLVLLVR